MKSKQVIWKFPLKMDDSQTIDMPVDAYVLSIQTQHNIPCLWVMCSSDAPKRTRTFETFGTGHPMPIASREYVGTYQVNNGNHVFHVFERFK
ncbi:MAG: hypothetical protein ACFFCW_41440 [Candidatus Hodarchaeota archaeon]